MKKFLVFFTCLNVLAGACATPCTVDYIFDGDTFAGNVLLEDGIEIAVRVRLINVDTPEIHGECDHEIQIANRAKDRLAELIPVGSIAELTEMKDDKYLGRIDARVKTPDGRDVGAVLIRENLGRPYGGEKRQPWCP